MLSSKVLEREDVVGSIYWGEGGRTNKPSGPCQAAPVRKWAGSGKLCPPRPALPQSPSKCPPNRQRGQRQAGLTWVSPALHRTPTSPTSIHKCHVSRLATLRTTATKTRPELRLSLPLPLACSRPLCPLCPPVSSPHTSCSKCRRVAMESSPTAHAFPGEPPQQPRQLPSDLPTSLDDRREPRKQEEMEVYDAWQGECRCPPSGHATLCRGGADI